MDGEKSFSSILRKGGSAAVWWLSKGRGPIPLATKIKKRTKKKKKLTHSCEEIGEKKRRGEKREIKKGRVEEGGKLYVWC